MHIEADSKDAKGNAITIVVDGTLRDVGLPGRVDGGHLDPNLGRQDSERRLQDQPSVTVGVRNYETCRFAITRHVQARALSLGERVREARVRVRSRKFRRAALTRPSATLSPRERASLERVVKYVVLRNERAASIDFSHRADHHFTGFIIVLADEFKALGSGVNRTHQPVFHVAV